MFKNDSFSIFIRLCFSVVGTSIIALGIVFFRLSSLGIDPATAADIGISNTFNWYLGNYQLIFKVILFLTFCIFDRSQFGIGTLINMSLPGYIMQKEVARLKEENEILKIAAVLLGEHRK